VYTQSQHKDLEISVSEDRLGAVVPSREGDLHSPDTQPFVVQPDEDTIQRIRALAERKGKDPQALVTEFILQRLFEEEKCEGMLDPPSEHEDSHDASPAQHEAEIYTDGGCRGNPGPGGWAAMIYQGPKQQEIYGAEKDTTNQRMELRAAIEGLRYLKDPTQVKLYSDSAYVLNAMNEGWLVKWEQNGWKKSDKKPVKNADLWQELLGLSRLHEVEWIKVAGHAGNPGNERCHTLVQLAIHRVY
jgi:ribonuclease HI